MGHGAQGAGVAGEGVSRVLGIGACNIDYLGVVERHPSPGRRQELLEFSIQGGGAVPTALATLAAFGVEVEYAGKLSDDDFGRFLAQELESADVGTRHLVVEPGRWSPFCFVAHDVSSGKQTVFSMPGTLSPLGHDEIPLEAVEKAEILLVDGAHRLAQTRAAEHARERGRTVVTDAAVLQEGMGDLLALTDVLVASERFAADVAPRADLAETLQELCAMGPKTVVLTLGPDGSVGLRGDKLVRESAATIDALVDSAGAGGVYRGAFIYGLLEGWALERAMHFASVAAGLKCEVLGRRAGIPALEQVLERL
jgi:sugar/nucleoside kinase (ribokinase family)